MTETLGLNWEDRAGECALRWQLSEIVWRPDVSTAHVGFCNSPFGPAVLKVSIEPGMVGLEALALSHIGESCPKAYAVAEDMESLLLERIEVVGDLSSLYPDAEEEIEVFLPFLTAVISNSDLPNGFPTLEEYAFVFSRVRGRTMSDQVAQLLDVANHNKSMLMGKSTENRLLHGDMHHFNLLKDTSGRWRLIDPHGVVGHPYYELGAFLRNPWGPCYTEPGVHSRLSDRISVIAERLGVAQAEAAMWGFYGAAFSIAWSLEGGSADVDGMTLIADACLTLT